MKTAIYVTAYNRPHYLAECLCGLTKDPIAMQSDIFVFLDGGPDSTQAANAKLVDWILAPAKTGGELHTIKRDANYGVGHNMIEARRYLFDGLGYDRAMLVEDDCVLMPHAFGLNDRLQDWCDRHFTNVGVTTIWCRCAASADIKFRHQRTVKGGNTNWITAMWTRDAWLAVRPMYELYERSFLPPIGEPYSSRPHRKITDWLLSCQAEVADAGWSPRGDQPFPEDADYFTRSLMDADHMVSSQDGVGAMAMVAAGMVKAYTTVNRATYIGRQGEHGTPDQYEQSKYHLILPDIMRGDHGVADFVVEAHDKSVVVV